MKQQKICILFSRFWNSPYINDFGYNLDRVTTNIKPVFKLSSNEKIKFLDFSESDKVKRFKLKHKKRLILVTEDNTVSIVSYYLGNLTFLLTAFKVSDKYKIINFRLKFL